MAALGRGVCGVATGEPIVAAARQQAVFDELNLPLARIDMYAAYAAVAMSWLPLASMLQHARALHFNMCFEPFVPRTVNGTGHTGPSEFCATSI